MADKFDHTILIVDDEASRRAVADGEGREEKNTDACNVDKLLL